MCSVINDGLVKHLLCQSDLSFSHCNFPLEVGGDANLSMDYRETQHFLDVKVVRCLVLFRDLEH